MHYAHVICLTRTTIKLHKHSDSFQYAIQRKGGSTHSFGGFTWLPIEKKKSVIFFLASCSYQMNLIHVNDFDLNLAVFSMVIFISTFHTMASVSVL